MIYDGYFNRKVDLFNCLANNVYIVLFNVPFSLNYLVSFIHAINIILKIAWGHWPQEQHSVLWNSQSLRTINTIDIFFSFHLLEL